MRTIPIHVDAAKLGAIHLGKQGESLACRVRFYASKWHEDYPEAEYQLFVSPPGATPYLATISEDNGVVTWELAAEDTTIPGTGSVELILTDGETKIKSVTYRTTLDKSPSSQEPGSAPQVHPTWWENAITMINEATEEAVSSIDGALESEKAEAKAAIAEAAEEAIESIPEDYTALAGEVSSLKDHIAEHGNLLYSIGLGEDVALSNDDFFPGFWSTSLQTGGAFANLRTHQEMLPNNGPVVVHVESEDLSNICVTATGYKADGSYNGYPVQNAPISNGKYTLSLSGTYPYYRIAIAKFVNNAYVALPSDVKITVGEKGDEAVLKLLDKQKYRLFDSVQKPITFEGHMLAYGDSITAGVTSPNLAVTENSYIKLLANHVGMTLGNRAISGTCITDSDTAPNSIYKRVTSWTYAADVIIVAGGTNDYTLGMPLGEFGSTDITTFYGALKGICEHFKANYAESTVVFITPIPQTVEQAAAILPLDAYRSAIFEVATSYGYNVVDGSSLGMPEKADAWGTTMVADACHPTEAGHALYFRSLCSKLL